MATREVPEELVEVYDEQIHEYIGVLIRRLDTMIPGTDAPGYLFLCERIERLLGIGGDNRVAPMADDDGVHDLTPDEVKRRAAVVRVEEVDTAATEQRGGSRRCPGCGAGKNSKKHAEECGGKVAQASGLCSDCGHAHSTHVHRVKCMGANDGRHHWSLGSPVNGVVRGTCECGAERDFPSEESSKW